MFYMGNLGIGVDRSDNWHMLVRDMMLLDTAFTDFKNNGYMTEEQMETVKTERTALVPFVGGLSRESASLLLPYDLNKFRELLNGRNRKNRYMCLRSFRIYRNIIARLVIMMYAKIDEPFDNVIDVLTELEHVCEIVREWKNLEDVNHDCLIDQIDHFLTFEAKCLNTEDEFAIQGYYDEYRNIFEYSSVFLLVDCMALQNNTLAELREKIQEDLNRFQEHPFFYDFQARYLIYDQLTGNYDIADTMPQKNYFSSKLTDVKNKYMQGIEKTNSDELWRMYLATADEIKKVTENTMFSPCSQTFWIQTRSAAQRAGKLDGCQTMELLKVVPQFEYQSVITNATYQFPQCTDFWCLLLEYDIKSFTNNLNTLIMNFGLAMAALKDAHVDDLFRIFDTFICFLTTVDPDNAENVYLIGIGMRPDLARKLIMPYFRWLSLVNGVATCRKMLDQSYISYAPLEFFLEMAQAEQRAYEPSQRAIRFCFDHALRLYGSISETIWEQYIRHELAHGERIRVPELYARAKAQCRPGGREPSFESLKRSRLFRSYVKDM